VLGGGECGALLRCCVGGRLDGGLVGGFEGQEVGEGVGGGLAHCVGAVRRGGRGGI
jgi:hypothetical protein